MGKEDVPMASATVVDEASSLLPGGPPATGGIWKEGLCGCCKFGPWHPSFLNAWCFPQILLGQVLTRLKLNMLGEPAPEAVWKMTFKYMLVLVIFIYGFFAILGCPPEDIDVADDDQHEVTVTDTCPKWQRITTEIVSFLFALYTLYVMIKARAAVRAKFGISTQCCAPFLEDCCCVFWCSCCTVSQLARETANYDVYASHCCSTTGLPGSPEEPIGLVVV